MTDLIDTTEMYLRTVLELEEEGVPALRARIAERLGQSGPTVSQTVARMERDGLLSIRDDRSIALSAEGRLRAVRVMRKHRLAERLLLDVLGLEPEFLHAEACRWEHVMSERVERKIVALLADPSVSPYGNPIPGLAELGVGGQAEAGRPLPDGGTGRSLAELLAELVGGGDEASQVAVPAGDGGGPAVDVEVIRLGEPVQENEDVLTMLWSAGLRPGAVVQARLDGDEVVIGQEAARLPLEAVAYALVRPRP